MSNKDLIQQGFNAMNDRNLGYYDSVIAPNYVNHDMPTPAPGPEGLKMVLGMFIQAFPDFKVVVEDLVGEANKVASRGYFTGTHQGEFMGMPATGKTVKVKYMDFWRFENGKAVENWVNIDNLGLMQQLGAVPTP